MKPEVIRLFGENDSSPSSTPQLTEDLDSFWNLTQTLIESRQRLERPFHSVLERSAALRTELKQARIRLKRAEERISEAEARGNRLEIELKNSRQLSAQLTQRVNSVQKYKEAILRWKEQVATSLKEHQDYARQLAAYAESARATVQVTQNRNKELARSAEEHRRRWTAMLESDQKLREALNKLRADSETKILERETSFTKERNKLGAEIESLQAKNADLEAALALARKEVQTGRSALEITTRALHTYQSQWKAVFDSNLELQKMLGERRTELDLSREPRES